MLLKLLLHSVLHPYRSCCTERFKNCRNLPIISRNPAWQDMRPLLKSPFKSETRSEDHQETTMCLLYPCVFYLLDCISISDLCKWHLPGTRTHYIQVLLSRAGDGTQEGRFKVEYYCANCTLFHTLHANNTHFFGHVKKNVF